MDASHIDQFDPELDLKFERIVDLPPEHFWAGWTESETLKRWFCPLPWKTVDCEIDLVPGGIFRTVMRGPDSEEVTNIGCYLEITRNRRLIWTGAFGPGFRPRDTSTLPFVFTAIISFEPIKGRTRYSAHVLHSTPEGRKRHEEMGFEYGWSLALDQLIGLAKPI